MQETYYLSFASRILVYALAATSLNLILGYGGMISFGHAASSHRRLRVEHLIAEGVASAWIGWPAAVAASALAALVIGAVSLRTRGVYFIEFTEDIICAETQRDHDEVHPRVRSDTAPMTSAARADAATAAGQPIHALATPSAMKMLDT